MPIDLTHFAATPRAYCPCQSAGMVKFVFCLRRKDGMALEEFQRYWREEHAPLVQQYAGALGILRYVQSHTRPGPEADLLRASRVGPRPTTGWPSSGSGTRRP